MRRMLTAICLASSCSVVLGAEVIDQRFEVVITQDGQEQAYATTVVPNLADAACYYWYLRFDAETTSAVTLVETLTLPEPLAAWQDYTNDPAAETQINPDAQSAVTTFQITPGGEGWTSHGWCVAAGDPMGPHRMAVVMDGSEIAAWDFSVVPVEEFDFGTAVAASAPPPVPYQPSNTARDVNQSW